MLRPSLLALLLLPSLWACNNSAWECARHGDGRRCSCPLALPEGWECYTKGGHLACTAPQTPPLPGWSCSDYGGRTICLLPLAAPGPEPQGWQCHIEAGQRLVCEGRRLGNGPWDCTPRECSEAYPDMPSPDDWECINSPYAIECRGRFLTSAHPRWHCRLINERFVCIDLDPDLPPLKGGARCVHDNTNRAGRTCKISAQDPCQGCPGLCREGVCFPMRATPECYFNRDCPPKGVCSMGICAKP